MRYLISLLTLAILLVAVPAVAGNITLMAQGELVFATVANNDTSIVEIDLREVDWRMPNISSYAYMDGDTLGGAANAPTTSKDTTANFVVVTTHDTSGMNYSGVLGSSTRGPAKASNGDSLSIEYAFLEDGTTFGSNANYYGTWHMAARTLSSDRATSGINVANFTGLKFTLPTAKLAVRFIFYPDSVLSTTGNSAGQELKYRVYGVEN